MTKTKIMRPTWRKGDSPAGFRIGPNGEIEEMTEAEAQAAIWRVLREVCAALSPKRRLH
jgi:hypothetical protein